MKSMIIRLISILSIIFILSCAAPLRNHEPDEEKVLDAFTLRQIHKDIRYTHFYYNDGSIQEGLMLSWDIDSVRIKTYGEEQPRNIPVKNMERIEIVVGNNMFKYLMIAAPLGLLAFAAIDPPEFLGGDGEPSMAALLAPMAIVSSMIVGATREKRAEYFVPPDFYFDYQKEKSYFDLLE